MAYHSWIFIVAGAGRVRLCQSLYIFVSPIDQTYTQLHVAHLRFTETYIQVRCVIYCLASALEKLHQPKTEHLCKLGWIMNSTVYVENAVFRCLPKIPLEVCVPGALS